MKSLKSFDFQTSGGSNYEWDKLLDGNIYQLEEGKDYTCKQTTFATLARSAGKKKGISVKIAKVDGGTVIQAGEKLKNAPKPKAKAKKKDGEAEAAPEAPAAQ